MFTSAAAAAASFENTKLTNNSANELKFLYVNKFSEKLGHRHIIFLLHLEKLMIIIPNNTL